MGEIYEGLLEFKVEIAEDEPVCAVGSRKKPHWKKQSEVTNEDTVHFTKQIGEPYITNDKGERKATGSYYTPHYIVQYIVEHTVGEQLKRFEKEKGWYDDITGSEPDFRTLYAKIAAEEADDEKQSLDTLWAACKSDGERRTFLLGHLEREWGKHRFDLATRALNLKVLDPAMGSGHFLVHVVDVISESIATYLNQYSDSPVSKELEVLRRGILQNVQKQDVKIDQEKLADVNLIKRMVMKRCVYGVDLNPMAGELAKLSLWLDSFTVGAPLSFLDHHLRCGNSLIGTSISEVRSALEGEKRETHTKLSLLTSQFTGLMRAVELMQEVGELSDATIGEVEESQARYGRAIGELAPFKALLDVWLSEHFRNKGAQEAIKQRATIVEAAIKHVLGRSQVFDNNRQVTLGIVTKASRLAGSKRFFHWELEFPEVWYEGGKQRANPGFDAVIGNPPYLFLSGRGSPVRRLKKRGKFKQAQQLQQEIDYLTHVFPSSSVGCKDYYKWFINKGMSLAAARSCFSLITSNTWISLPKFADVREILSLKNQLVQVCDLGFEVFEDPSVPAAIFVSRRIVPIPPSFMYANMKAIDKNSLNVELLNTFAKERLQRHEIDNVQFLIFQHPLSRQLLYDFCPAYPSKSVLKISEGEHSLDIDKHELKEFPNKSRIAVICDWELGRYKQPSIAYTSRARLEKFNEDLHSGPRLLLRKTGDRLIACSCPTEGLAIAHQNVYVVKAKVAHIDSHFTLSLFSSSLFRFIYQKSPFGQEGRVEAQLRIEFLHQLPIRRIFFNTLEAERADQGKRLQELYRQENFEQLLEEVATCFPKGDKGEFIVFTRSIPIEQAIEKGFLTKEQAESWVLEPGDPSGYDENGNPLERSDIVHDLLVYLAEIMIELNKDKRETTERFWTDLEGVTDSETFKKLRRGKQEKTLANRSEACRPFVNPESGSAKHLDEGLAWSEEAFKDFTKLLSARILNLSNLLDVYRKYATEYKGLVERREVTDRLIDQIVYRLYGLTDEEIRIVEEATTRK